MNKSLSPHLYEDLSAMRAKVAHRREYLQLLQTELFNTRAYLQEFTDLYNAKMSKLENEYARLQRLLEESGTEDEPPGEYRRRFHQHGRPGRKHTRSGKATDERQALPSNPEYEEQIRLLFRNLAKRFHPDLAENPREKKERERIMAEINVAYTARDLKALESLAKQPKASSNGTPVSPSAELASLKVELGHLEGMIFEVEHTIRELDLSPAMQMRSDYQSGNRYGRNLFEDLRSNLQERIDELREHLLGLGLEPEEIDLKEE